MASRSRRTFLQLGLSVAAAPWCAGRTAAAWQAARNATTVRVQLLHPSLALYLFVGGDANTLVFDREGDVVVVDPKSAGWGKVILDNVSLLTDQPVNTVIATHAHTEHAGAIGEFPDAKQIVAHEAAARRLKAAGVAGGLTTIVTDRLSLFDQAPKVDLYYFGRGHTDGDLVVAFPETGIVHVGDLFPLRAAAPVIDTANGGSVVALPETLARIVKDLKGFRRVSTGHDIVKKATIGDLATPEEFDDYVEFNRVFLDKVRAARASGRTAAQAAVGLQLPDKFKAYDMRQAAANVAAIYQELGR